MKQFLSSFLILMTSVMAYGQLGIGTDTPSPSSQLDIVSRGAGLLIPRIALSGMDDTGTISEGNVTSLLVYNITDNEDIEPGFFYWDGSIWQKLVVISELEKVNENAVSGPWSKSGTEEVSTHVDDDMYHLGMVGIGTNNLRATLHVVGSILTGNEGSSTNSGQSFIVGDDNTINVSEEESPANAFVSGSGNSLTRANGFVSGIGNSVTGGRGSFAFGENNEVTSNVSSAFGTGNKATNFNSMVWGQSNVSNGNGSTVFGQGNEAAKFLATAWGQNNVATGNSSTVWGARNNVSKYLATAWGHDNISSGNSSTAWGSGNNVSNFIATAWGQDNVADGNGSTVWGKNNRVSKVASTAWGFNNEASQSGSTAWGSKNKVSGSVSTAFGTGITVSGSRSVGIALADQESLGTEITADEVMAIMGGNVGIDEVSPDEKLVVNGTIKATDINFTGLPVFDDEAAATAGGLNTGDCYRTAAGVLMIKL